MRLVIGCLAGLLASSAFADEFSVQSKVSDALVTPMGGIITRAIPVDLSAGTHVITVFGAPVNEGVAGNGIDFADGSGLTLISEAGEMAVARDPIYKQSGEYQALERAVDTARGKLHSHRTLEAEQQAIVQAAEVRLTFVKQFANGGSSVLSLEQLTDPNLITNLTAQLGEQAAKAVVESQEAMRKMEALRVQGQDLQGALDRAQQRLANITPADRAELALTITINAAQPFKGDINLRHISRDVHWDLLSDVMLSQDETKGALTIAQNAVLAQQTGEDWDDVAITLSTVDLNRASGMNLPHEWIKRLYDPSKRKSKRTMSAKQSSEYNQLEYAADQMGSLVEPMMIEVAEEAAGMRAGNSMTVAGQTQIFEINALVDVKSNGDFVTLPLQEIDMDIDLYARATNHDDAGYLYADITNETGGRILPSLASLYRDGQYFGKFNMPEIVAGDEYPLQLGVLDGLRIDHSVLKREDGDRGLLSSSQIAESRFKTVVTSLLDYDIPVRLYDRIPVSESEDLIVKEYAKPNITERDIDGRRGVVSWNWDIAAGANHTIEFGYDLSWPSGFAVE
jgi:uncharacterized protein (TIGR02231 family)